MAKNCIAAGDVLQVTLGADITSGSPILVGDVLGVALTDGLSGETISVGINGVWELSKVTHATDEAIAQGVKVYWVVASSKVSAVAGSNKHIGYAYVASGSTATTAQVKLLG